LYSEAAAQCVEGGQTVAHLKEIEKAHDHRPVRPIKVTQVENLDALWSRKEEWNALVERNNTNTIFQTFEWQVSWCRAFKDDIKLLVLLAETDAGLVGIAPLLLLERPLLGCLLRTVKFIGTDSSDYCDFIIAYPDVLPPLLQWLIDNAHLWDLLHLSNIAETSPLVGMLPKFFGQQGYRMDMHVLYECPTRVFGDSVEDRKLLNKKSLKRYYNYFRRSGELEFKRCTGVEEIESYMDLFFEQHIKRWRQADFSSQFLDEKERTFYRELVTRLTPTGWLLFSVLSFNQMPIAFHFGFAYNNRIFWIKPTFNIDFSDHAPGQVLLKYSLEDALERKMNEFDFTVGEESYKYRFANHKRLNYAALVYRHSIHYYIDKFVLNTKAFIKRSPMLHGLGRRLRKKWTSD
jgi:CelD/BcsL family acetyltransferase involved in cellulose biosynthesis